MYILFPVILVPSRFTAVRTERESLLTKVTRAAADYVPPVVFRGIRKPDGALIL